MGISNRLWDDDVFVPAGAEMPTPVLAGQLLSSLHLLDASRDEQIEGVRAWLRDHKSSKSLEVSLNRRGLGAALQAH